MHQNRNPFDVASATSSDDDRIQQLNREMLSLTMAERRRHWKTYVRRLGELRDGAPASPPSRPTDLGLAQSSVPREGETPATHQHI